MIQLMYEEVFDLFLAQNLSRILFSNVLLLACQHIYGEFCINVTFLLRNSFLPFPYYICVNVSGGTVSVRKTTHFALL